MFNVLSFFADKRPRLGRTPIARLVDFEPSREERALLLRFRRLPRHRRALLLEMARRLDATHKTDFS